MKQFLGLVLILLGIFVGFGMGLGWAFIGGIISLIHEIRAPVMDNGVLAFSICRILFAGLIGWLSALIFFIPGTALMKS